VTAAVKKLLEKNASPNFTDMHELSALYEAARTGHKENMDELVKVGAKVCMSESREASMLFPANFDGDAIILLRRLLQAGIHVNASDYDTRSASHFGCGQRQPHESSGGIWSCYLTLEDRWHNTIDDEADSAQSGPLLAYLETLKKCSTDVHDGGVKEFG
jgi:hypothetical protein